MVLIILFLGFMNFTLLHNYYFCLRENFYSNFVKGKLLYSLGRYPFDYFLASYQQDKRWVKQQVLNLNQDEKQAFFKFLEINALPQNSNYLYDPSNPKNVQHSETVIFGAKTSR